MKDFFHIEEGVLISYTGREETAVVPQGVHTIGEGAFKACVSLKRAVLPAGLWAIGDNAFKGCRKLEEVVIPGSVSYIGSYAFHRCHALRQAVLPPSVEELKDCTFLYCDNLTRVCMPGVKRLGKQVFVNDVLLENLEISSELQEDCICDVFTGCERIRRITFENGESCVISNAVEVVTGALLVPSSVYLIAVDILRMMELDGKTLVRFLTNLKHVEIPEGIEKLGKSCFFDKRGIISVKLPKSLKEIGSRAFRNCISLEKISFEGAEPLIHEDAFHNCTSLKTVRTCDGTEYVFQGLLGMTGAEIPQTVQNIHWQVMGNFRLSGSILLKYLGSESRVVIPEGVTKIAEEAFAGNEAIDRVILPESLQEIGAEAFKDCLLLQTVQFPERLCRIGPGAFEHCVKLIRVHLPLGIRKVRERTFRHCLVLKEAGISANIGEIGDSAFYGCETLAKISFPESLTSIGSMAFYQCSGLKEVKLFPAAEYVNKLAFARSGVRKVRIGSSGMHFGADVFGGCTKLKILVLEEGVRHIPDKLAYGCTALEQVRMPGTLESAGRHVWERTPFLEHWIEQQTERRHAAIPEPVFWDGRNLEGKVQIPEQVRILAGGAFYGNEKVTEIYLTEHVQWIGPAAFKGCKNLRRVWISSAVQDLQDEVFSGCRELERIALSESDIISNAELPLWRSIGERAFYQCKKIQKVRLDQVKRIGKEAFSGCLTLEKGIINGGSGIGERAFEGTKYLEGVEGEVIVLGGILLSGGSCKGEICLPEDVTGIAAYAFAGNREITKVVLPGGLRWIEEGAFFGCSGIQEVIFPGSLYRIGERAFEKCTALQKVETSALQVGTAAFAWCGSLTAAVLPALTILGERLFEGCGKLEQCRCEQVQEILAHCFGGCGALQKISPAKIRAVHPYAFAWCDSLECIEFMDEVCLREHALEDCGGLKKIVLGGEKGILHLSEYALSGCTALETVVWRGEEWEFHNYADLRGERLPEMVRLLFYSAFSCFEVRKEEDLYGYRGAGRSVKIPEGIRHIGAEVFRDRLTLTDVEVPDSVEYIGARAFHGTTWLFRLREKNPLVVVKHMLLDGSGCVGEVKVPEDIRLICGWAFAGGTGIRKIHFLSDQVRVEEYAFRNCINLQEMIFADGSHVRFTGIADRERELPVLARQAALDSMNCFKTDEKGVLVECTGNLSRLKIAQGITAVGDGAFEDGNLLTWILLPDSVTQIRKRAFAGCKWLQEVCGAQHIEQVGIQAFSGCGRLRRVELSEAFHQMGDKAFENCTSLEEILLPEGLEEIPEKAFYRCHSLRQVKLPSSLKRIGKEAFAFCRELRDVFIPEGTVVCESAFRGSAVLPGEKE